MKRCFKKLKQKILKRKFDSFKIYIQYKDGNNIQEFFSDSISFSVFKMIVEQNTLGTKCRTANENDYEIYLNELKNKFDNPNENPYIYIDINHKKVELETNKIIKAEIIYD